MRFGSHLLREPVARLAVRMPGVSVHILKLRRLRQRRPRRELRVLICDCQLSEVPAQTCAAARVRRGGTDPSQEAHPFASLTLIRSGVRGCQQRLCSGCARVVISRVRGGVRPSPGNVGPVEARRREGTCVDVGPDGATAWPGRRVRSGGDWAGVGTCSNICVEVVEGVLDRLRLKRVVLQPRVCCYAGRRQVRLVPSRSEKQKGGTQSE